MSIAAIEAAFHTGAKNASARLVMLALAYCKNQETGECFPGQERIKELTGLSRRAVQYALQELEAADLIRRFERRRTRDKSRTSDGYILHFAHPDFVRDRLLEAEARQGVREADIEPTATPSFAEQRALDEDDSPVQPVRRGGAPRSPNREEKGKESVHEEEPPNPLLAPPPQATDQIWAEALWLLAPAAARKRSSKALVEAAVKALRKDGRNMAAVAGGLRVFYLDPDQLKEEGRYAPGIHTALRQHRWEPFVLDGAPPLDLEALRSIAFGEDEAAKAPRAWNGEPRPSDPIGTLENPGERRQRAWMREWTEGQQHLWRPHERGPKPGEQYCRVWPEILREHGITPFGEA